MSVRATYKGSLQIYTYSIRKGTSYEMGRDIISSQLGCPNSSIVLYYSPDKVLSDGRIANELVLVPEDGCICKDIIVKIRPLVGDHSHIIHSFWVLNGDEYKLVSPLVDIPPVATNVSSDPHEVGTYLSLIHI